MLRNPERGYFEAASGKLQATVRKAVVPPSATIRAMAEPADGSARVAA